MIAKLTFDELEDFEMNMQEIFHRRSISTTPTAKVDKENFPGILRIEFN